MNAIFYNVYIIENGSIANKEQFRRQDMNDVIRLNQLV